MSSQSSWTASVLPSVEEVDDLSGARPSSYFPTLDDCSDIQSPLGESLIVGQHYYGLVPSSEASKPRQIPGVSHCLSFEPIDRATRSNHSPYYPPGLLCSGPNYLLSAETPSSLQGPASSQSTRPSDIEDTSSREFSAASSCETKDSPNNAVLLYDVNSTDFTDTIAQSLVPPASQLRNNDNDRAEIARAENLDLENGDPLPVRKHGPLSCLDCGKRYFHRHELK